MAVLALARRALAGTQLTQEITASLVQARAQAHVSSAQFARTDSTSKAAKEAMRAPAWIVPAVVNMPWVAVEPILAQLRRVHLVQMVSTMRVAAEAIQERAQHALPGP